jgi:hypothetical protein
LRSEFVERLGHWHVVALHALVVERHHALGRGTPPAVDRIGCCGCASHCSRRHALLALANPTQAKR